MSLLPPPTGRGIAGADERSPSRGRAPGQTLGSPLPSSGWVRDKDLSSSSWGRNRSTLGRPSPWDSPRESQKQAGSRRSQVQVQVLLISLQVHIFMPNPGLEKELEPRSQLPF